MIDEVTFIQHPKGRFASLKKTKSKKAVLSAFLSCQFLLAIKSERLDDFMPKINKMLLKEVEQEMLPFQGNWLHGFGQSGFTFRLTSILNANCPNELIVQLPNYAVSQLPDLVQRNESQYFIIQNAKNKTKTSSNIDLDFMAFAVQNEQIHFYNPNEGIFTIAKDSFQTFLYACFSALLKDKSKHTMVTIYN